MNNVLPISKVRTQLPKLVDEASTLVQTTYITVKGKVKAAIIDARELEIMQATLEVLSDPELMLDIKKGREAIKNDQVISWEDVQKELGI